MAHLIKLKHPPHKNLLEKKITLTKLGLLKKLSEENRLVQFTTSRAHIENRIKHFLERKAFLQEAAKIRSINRYKMLLIADIVHHFIIMKREINEEICAIKHLAAKIVSNIVNDSLELKKFEYTWHGEDELRSFLSVTIFAPQTMIDELYQKYGRLHELFDKSGFFVGTSCAKGAQLRVESNGAWFYLDFAETTLDNILNRIFKHL